MLHLLLAVIYLAFISLGLPDSVLGAAWPSMYQELIVPVSFAGMIYAIISAVTAFSCLQCSRLTHRLGTGKVTLLSVATTALALFGFSTSHSFLQLCLWAVPYGLGAGCVDTSLNNYVALHYAGHHMNWLHCMWGIGASIGPYIMSRSLLHSTWQHGYRTLSLVQLCLTAVLFASLPLWKKSPVSGDTAGTPLPLSRLLRQPGAAPAIVGFFCYSALESTAGLWAASYLVLTHGIDARTAASFASLYFIGITAGRAVSGFVALKLNDRQMIHLGQAVILVGLVCLLLSGFGEGLALIGMVILGLGCAPVYPSMIHATPERFGAQHSQSFIGAQMTFAYVGNCLMPSVFGMMARAIGSWLFPWYLLLFLGLMFLLNEYAYRC